MVLGTTARLTLPPEPEAVGRARRAVREALAGPSDADVREGAVTAVSELATNAVVHAGTEFVLRIVTHGGAVRVEIEDGDVHLPVRSIWSQSAATGRGLQIVEAHVDRWDAVRTEKGKVVWFEIGHVSGRPRASDQVSDAVSEAVEVILLEVPIGTHWAWQEHATTLLREYLLFCLDEDPDALEQHAAASQALTLLREQFPAPHAESHSAADPPEALSTTSELVLRVPLPCVRLFDIVHDLVARALSAAQDGALLDTPPEPETISAMTEWVCGQITGQAQGAQPAPWRPAA